ncbi:MAG: hypothetical protein HN712_20685 [Gemmatimonadetes bacterium]|nr:hypothetical protein [Gemmatimonadota bacterium]MBT6145121.1 hypothetical protein [Gemmatimonadota bacterium]MBT7862744.1 hypothetical protein [Gemmatimonadota bacterium]
MTRRQRLHLLTGLVLSSVIGLSLSSCAWKISSMSYDGVARMSKPSDHPIPMIADTTSIERPFAIIGLVEADPANSLGTLGQREMLNAMRHRARQMGGDGLVNLRRPLSNYSRVRGPQDRELVDRDWPMNTGPTYRWVAEVISYDIPSAMPEETLGQGQVYPALRPRPGPSATRKPKSP